ncbi:MAG: hypothetical protein ACLFM9_00370 [Candidatus Aenigmatarchaeota archaeon]
MIVKQKEGAGAGAVVVVAAAIIIVLSIFIWNFMTVAMEFESQREVTPLTEAKGRFDNLDHFTNSSLFFSEHRGTLKNTNQELAGTEEMTWWDKGEDRTPDEDEFRENLTDEISFWWARDYFSDSDQRNLKEVDVRIDDYEPVDEGFVLNSTAVPEAIAEVEERKIKVYNEKNYSHEIDLRPFLLREEGDELTDNMVDEALEPLWEEFEGDATKDESTGENTECGDWPSWPSANPSTESSVKGNLNDKLEDISGDIQGEYGPEELGWSLNIQELEEFSSSSDVVSRDEDDSGDPCTCKNTTSGDEMSCGNCGEIEECEVEERIHTRERDFEYDYEAALEIEAEIEDGNEDYEVLTTDGDEVPLVLQFLINSVKFDTTEGNPYEA